MIDGYGADHPAEPPSAETGSASEQVLPPPATLPEELQRDWRCVVADLQERKVWKDSLASLVTSYVLAGATVARLELKIAAEGEFVAGADGAQKPHPGSGLLRSSRETHTRLGVELGLTSQSRSRKPQPAQKPHDPDLFDLGL